MPRGGARPGAGRPKKQSDDPTSTPKKQTPKKSAAVAKPPSKSGMTKSVVVAVNDPSFVVVEQTLNIPMEFEHVRDKTVEWLKAMGVHERINPFVIEEYAICVARVRQLEHEVSLHGADHTSNITGSICETPNSRRIERYMKRADSAMTLMNQAIRDAGLSDALDGYDGPMAMLLQGAPAWRQ